MLSLPEINNRVLVIDADPAIHAEIRGILCRRATHAGGSPLPARVNYQVDAVAEASNGLAAVQGAAGRGEPYAVLFLGVRCDQATAAVETTLALWRYVPDLQVVICTGCPDFPWDETLAQLGGCDRLVILKKPLDAIEVFQLTRALTAKWSLLRQSRKHAAELEARVQQRTAELQAANTTLQEEIAQRIVMEVDLRRAKDTAESADRAKSAFLANMSHEIRTPMNGVIGMANLLLATPLNSEQRDLAQTLCESSESLLTIINDILDFSKIEAGRLTLEAVDFELAEHLELALELNADAANRKGLELVMDIHPSVPARVRGDPVRLRQIVLNLVGNAVKFTARGEVVVAVQLTATQSGKNFLRFEVTDTGIGISPAVQEQLFEPFTQADSSTTRRFGGTGLGLAICKRLAELMYGEIGVTSELGKGSTFWFTVALDDARSPSPPVTLVPSQLENHHALIVDDNATNLKLLDHLCARWHLRHACAPDASTALSALRSAAVDGTPYDLVILDHHMPNTDGIQLADLIRTDATIPAPTLVLLTSRGERLPQGEMEAHGLAACELKPLHPDRLRATLARSLAVASPASGSGELHVQNLVVRPPPTAVATILVAEDNSVNQKVTLLQLRNLGYAADLVTNGREAIDAIRRKPYVLVLMDAQMPELDGIEATRIIRDAQAAGDPHIPAQLRIVAMTANAMSGDREACIDAGMDDYLSKPVKPEALREILGRYMEGIGGAPGVRKPVPTARLAC